MLAEQSLKAGNLVDALNQLQSQVRKDTANAKLRVFLFQLLAVLGDWERALNQLTVSGELDAGNLAMVQTYREAIRCEIMRQKVFRGETTPLIFGQPEQWLAQLLIAAELSAKGQYQQAQEIRLQAFDAAPTTSGTINGQPFSWIADADSRLGPVLEAVVNGRYYWIPFCRIAKITLEAPTDLRDLVWMPAEFTWANGGNSVGLIPARYAGSESSEDSAIRLGRKTVWLEPEPEEFQGFGQRILATDTADYSLCEVRELIINSEQV
jgi:type VI secretion system protein ImpE